MSCPMCDHNLHDQKCTCYAKRKNRSLLSEIDRRDKRISSLEEALPDPKKLGALADWLDLKFPNDSDPEVQRDLRQWARKAREALGESKPVETYDCLAELFQEDK